MACWLYEGLLLFGLLFVGGLLIGGLGALLGLAVPPLVLQPALLLLQALYFIWFWPRGQTLAMKTWHIRVVDPYGRPLTRIRALARFALCWCWLLPPMLLSAPYHLPMREIAVLVCGWVMVWALLSRFMPQGQFIHDWLAGTRLVNSSPA